MPTSTSTRDRRGPDAGALRPPADLAGADQHHQERRPRRSPRVPPAELGTRPHPRRAPRARATTSSSTSIDNGIGLPKENRNRLLEPYVTTREKGTGLGLAIVGRILEEHGGGSSCTTPPRRSPGQRGAWIRLRFAAEPVERAAAAGTEPQKHRRINQPSEQRAHGVRHSDRRRRSRHPRAGRRHSGGRGLRAPAPRATATRRSRRSSARRPNLVFLDIWLQGSRLDGLQLLDVDQAASTRICRS